MSRKLIALSLTAAFLGGTAFAETPNVAVDIAPVHSLVARVMQGVGPPNLIVQPGSSPHEYTLRPSEAAALQNADIVFWIGPDLTPWLTNTIQTLASDANVTSLLEADGTIELAFRESTLFEAHDHDHGGHDDHDDHGEDEKVHKDIELDYTYHCGHPDRLAHITVNLFEHFEHMSEIELIYLGPDTQKQDVLNRKNTQMKLAK